jgi:hypothetical protein
MGTFEIFANEQLYHIFSMLDVATLVRLGLTGRGMHEIMNNDSLWHILFRQHYDTCKVAMLEGITWAHHYKALGTCTIILFIF